MQRIRYLQLSPNMKPPMMLDFQPFRAIVIIEEKKIPSKWQGIISDWLVQQGCLYMMAWGNDCSSWDDTVDLSNVIAWIDSEIPEERFVMTTWHEAESLRDVFWFSKHLAVHPHVDFENTLLLHISKVSKEEEFLELHKQA